MGGYGLYVWGSYVVTLVLLAVEVVLLISRRRQVVKELRGVADQRRSGP
jgi:heme exporter protein D